MERLSQPIEAYSIAGKWQPISITRGGTPLSHLMFADDVVLFGEATREQAQHIKECLKEFCDASGQKISMAKSSIYFSSNTDDATIAEVCNILEMQHTDNLGRYLGVPTVNGRVAKVMFQDVITRVEQRLAGWKSKCLSLAGQITLIKSTITAIPAYVMQSTRLPKSVCDDLDNQVRRFLWAGTAMERKPHLVAWDIFTKEKPQGDLGIRSMRQLNSAFLMKLGWKLHSEPAALWVRLLKEKYTRGPDLANRTSSVRPRTSAWQGIMETMEKTSKGMGVAIGDGRNTEFWNHIWLDGKQLIEHVIRPALDALHSSRVRDFWTPGSGWNWTSLAQFLPTEILQCMASFDLGADEIDDTPLWIASKKGSFTIQSAIQILQASDSMRELQWEWLWHLRLPYRIQVFLWLLFHRKLLTNAE